MGNAPTTQACCVEKYDKDSTTIAVERESMVATTDGLVDIVEIGAQEFRHLQGGWYRKTDGTKLGDMIDQGFLWDARIKVGVDYSAVHLFADRLSMTLMGQRHEAVLSLHAQPTLTWADGDVGELKMVLLVRTDLGMQKGKIAAQCGHAVLGAYHMARQQQNDWLDQWESCGAMKIALKVGSEDELCDFASRAAKRDLTTYTVRDAGHTQVAPHSRTVCAIGPAPAERLATLGCTELKLL
eukprot:symbB.v1.2.033097.t1/scaffold3920.1/size48317/1